MDVKTTFYNGELEEAIYMTQPDGFVVKGHEDKVCKLYNPLYGLKQTHKQWHDKFDLILKSTSFCLNEVHQCESYYACMLMTY